MEMGSQYADFEKSSFLRPRPARSNLALPKVCKLYSRQDGRTTFHLDNEVQQWSEHMLRIDLGISPGSVSCQRSAAVTFWTAAKLSYLRFIRRFTRARVDIPIIVRWVNGEGPIKILLKRSSEQAVIASGGPIPLK